MTWPRTIEFPDEARLALLEIVGIMSDHVVSSADGRWSVGHLADLELRLTGADPDAADATVVLDIEDAGLLLDGMAFTEIASADLPWIDMVRWTSDFIGAELRQHWTDEQWLSVAAC